MRCRFLAALTLCLPASAALAASVVPMTVATLADHAGQVVSGEVTAVESYWTGRPARIESRVTFESVSYLKGAHPGAGDTFALTVPGGRVDTFEMRLEGAPRFEVGQSWLLFVLPAYRTHPVVGISQGAFRIARDADGVERVERDGRAVLGLDGQGFVRLADAARAEGDAPHPAALTRGEFVELVAPILAASRDHALAEPAGRRLPVRYTPGTLQEAAR